MASSNLPPGVTDADLPGNSPRDHRWQNQTERFWDAVGDLSPQVVCAILDIEQSEPKLCHERIQQTLQDAFEEGSGIGDLTYQVEQWREQHLGPAGGR